MEEKISFNRPKSISYVPAKATKPMGGHGPPPPPPHMGGHQYQMPPMGWQGGGGGYGSSQPWQQRGHQPHMGIFRQNGQQPIPGAPLPPNGPPYTPDRGGNPGAWYQQPPVNHPSSSSTGGKKQSSSSSRSKSSTKDSALSVSPPPSRHSASPNVVQQQQAWQQQAWQQQAHWNPNGPPPVMMPHMNGPPPPHSQMMMSGLPPSSQAMMPQHMMSNRPPSHHRKGWNSQSSGGPPPQDGRSYMTSGSPSVDRMDIIGKPGDDYMDGGSIGGLSGSDKDKHSKDKSRGYRQGRVSYRCGRCGVPKKGHVCPYQPKLKRRPGEPSPEMKNMSTQVEMDEYMILRRLNVEIQGFPESYAVEPHLEDMVGTETHQSPGGIHDVGPISINTSGRGDDLDMGGGSGRTLGPPIGENSPVMGDMERHSKAQRC